MCWMIFYPLNRSSHRTDGDHFPPACSRIGNLHIKRDRGLNKRPPCSPPLVRGDDLSPKSPNHPNADGGHFPHSCLHASGLHPSIIQPPNHPNADGGHFPHSCLHASGPHPSIIQPPNHPINPIMQSCIHATMHPCNHASNQVFFSCLNSNTTNTPETTTIPSAYWEASANIASMV